LAYVSHRAFNLALRPGSIRPTSTDPKSPVRREACELEVLQHFGGVPSELLFDQLKAVIIDDQREIGGRVNRSWPFEHAAGYNVDNCGSRPRTLAASGPRPAAPWVSHLTTFRRSRAASYRAMPMISIATWPGRRSFNSNMRCSWPLRWRTAKRFPSKPARSARSSDRGPLRRSVRLVHLVPLVHVRWGSFRPTDWGTPAHPTSGVMDDFDGI